MVALVGCWLTVVGRKGFVFPMGADCSGEFWVTIKAHVVVGG
jgi:hypothetical protein